MIRLRASALVVVSAVVVPAAVSLLISHTSAAQEAAASHSASAPPAPAGSVKSAASTKKATPASVRPKTSASAAAAASALPPTSRAMDVPAAQPSESVPVVAPPPPVVSPAIAPPTCSQEQVDKLTSALGAWEHSYVENETSAYARQQCTRDEVLCLNRFGQASADNAPERLSVGKDVAVYAIVPSVDTAKLVVSTSISRAFGETAYNSEVPFHALSAPSVAPACELARLQKDALKSAALPVAKLASKPGLELLGVPADSWGESYWSSSNDSQIMQDWTIFVDAQGTRAPGFLAVGGKLDLQAGEVLSIDVTRTEKGALHPCSENHYEVVVDQGKYYLELALLAPFTYRGERKVQALPSVGSRELRLHVEEDWQVTAAVAFDYFPAGRQRGQLSSFRNCRTRSCIENWLGIQAGLGLGLPFKQWYLGVVIEPVSGFNVAIGAALLKGDFLVPGRAEGMVVSAGDSGSANSDFMFRPYVGFSVTQDVFNAIARASSSARELF